MECETTTFRDESETKMIGGLPAWERKAKIQKYLEKKQRKGLKKKVTYDCRSKVAEKRLRIKGRFVTKD